MAKHLETEVIQQFIVEIRKIQGTSSVTGSVAGQDVTERLLALLRGDWFISVVGYFLNHRPQSSYAHLDDEYKVQDLIYCLAVSLISDLQYEDPQQKNVGALASTRVDFSSAKTRIFIEVKLATDVHSMKKVEAEIHEDITKYGRQRIFSTLIFFVYCYQYTPTNPREFERGLTGQKVIDGHQFQTYCIVKP